MSYWLNGLPPKGEPTLCLSLDDAKEKLKRMVGIRKGDPDIKVDVVWIEPEVRVEITSQKYGKETFWISFDRPAGS
jgi:hypothetical protein